MYLLVITFNIFLNLMLIKCDSKCISFETCGGCIGYGFEICVWCSMDKHSGPRCVSEDIYKTDTKWCNGSIYNPKPEINITKMDPLNSGADGTKTIQLTPQYIKLKARPGVPVKFTMYYQPAKDYPLDVYYLMDYSSTMMIHKETLKAQGKNVYEQLSKLTNNVHLGVGSFVEKPALPFAGLRHHSYSFKNHLSLTKDIDEFQMSLESREGANYDEPEAALDALMQAIVCTKEVNWRNESRKIIILCTDSTYHSAGDGKFVGAIAPNDMKCHLNGTDYNKSLSLDYPSVSQINKVAADHHIKIIFAVDKRVLREYEALSKNIQGATNVELRRDSNVTDIIKKGYLELIRGVRIDGVNGIPPYIDLTFGPPDCSKENECKIKHQEKLQIQASLRIKHCPSNNKLTDTVTIRFVDLQETLTVKVDIDCQCDCENDGKGITNSSICAYSGTFQCGVCNCNKDRYGRTCQCSGSSSDIPDIEKCKVHKDDSIICSERGTCRCGKCEDCTGGSYGNLCQFDDSQCLRPGGIPCSGNGKCLYGKCDCNSLWTGEDCSCPNHDQDCINPNNKQVCSGNGVCNCGRCQCNVTETKNKMYSERFCDTETHCKDLEDKAQCLYFNEKSLCDKNNDTSNVDVEYLNKTEINAPKWQFDPTCTKELENGSIIVFRYRYQEYSPYKIQLKIQKELDEPPKANIWVAVGSAIFVVLLIGLITVIAWKILVDIHDSREYDKFAKEAEEAGFEVDVNPLYKIPTCNITNPTFQNRFHIPIQNEWYRLIPTLHQWYDGWYGGSATELLGYSPYLEHQLQYSLCS